MPDNSVDLVLTDPPYGIEWKPSTLFGKETPQTKALKDLQTWDKLPSANIFPEMLRIGNKCIIWGGNYFGDYLGACKSPLIWDKKTGANNYADGEMAWTTLAGTMRILHHQWCGAFKDSERGIQNLHPTQKPIAVMEWCIKLSKTTGIIFDPFCGSGTTCVAAKRLGRRYIGIDISEEYCNIARKRLEAEEKGITVKELEKGQGALFADRPNPTTIDNE
jgi:DNA modification methylase